jgi:hypothetical protein
MGPLYDSFNKNVIPRAQIAAPAFYQAGRCVAEACRFCRAAAGNWGLPQPRSGAIMTLW